MISVTPIFRPSWVLVPQAVASMVSFLSRENPGTLPNISRLVRSRTLNMALHRLDFARISVSSLLVAASLAETVLQLANIIRRRYAGYKAPFGSNPKFPGFFAQELQSHDDVILPVGFTPYI